MFSQAEIEKGLPTAQARKLLSHILRDGSIAFTRHARRELAKDGLSEVDARNVLKGGQIYEPAEFEHDSWRYRVHTPRMTVVIAFDSVTLCVVVTAWKKRAGR